MITKEMLGASKIRHWLLIPSDGADFETKALDVVGRLLVAAIVIHLTDRSVVEKPEEGA